MGSPAEVMLIQRSSAILPRMVPFSSPYSTSTMSMKSPSSRWCTASTISSLELTTVVTPCCFTIWYFPGRQVPLEAQMTGVCPPITKELTAASSEECNSAAFCATTSEKPSSRSCCAKEILSAMSSPSAMMLIQRWSANWPTTFRLSSTTCTATISTKSPSAMWSTASFISALELTTTRCFRTWYFPGSTSSSFADCAPPKPDRMSQNEGLGGGASLLSIKRFAASSTDAASPTTFCTSSASKPNSSNCTSMARTASLLSSRSNVRPQLLFSTGGSNPRSVNCSTPLASIMRSSRKGP
mmetsp:Transcript_100390/g.174182  ORF Transcript_100390/g.174182 Transcript_100390/m.174182 type:complete len:298 (+) Transcript_100390:71-964(+)